MVKRKSVDLPTVEEQNALRNGINDNITDNSFSLEVDALLSEMTIDISSKITKFTDIIQKTLSNLVLSEVICEDYLEQRAIKLELVNKSTSIKFAAPIKTCLIGSFSVKTAIKPNINVDIGVEMPDEMFSEQDVLNYVYFDKRKLYLSGLYVGLSSICKENEIKFNLFKGDCRKPLIVINSAKLNCSFQIFPMLSVNSCLRKRLRKINVNNVRPQSWIADINSKKIENKGKSGNSSDGKIPGSELLPTPSYTMCIIEDMVLTIQNTIQKAVFTQRCPIAMKIVSLLKAWLLQRDLRYRLNGIDGHSVSLLVVFLVQHQIVHSGLTVIQGFQAVLKFIVDYAPRSTILDFSDNNISQEKANQLLEHFAMCFLHPVAGGSDDLQYNIFWRVSLSSLDDLKREAAMSLANLQMRAEFGVIDSEQAFQCLFLQKAPFEQNFDMFVHIPVNLGGANPEYGSNFGQIESIRYHSENLVSRMRDYIESIVRYALSDRFISLSVWTQYVTVDGNNVNGVTSAHYPLQELRCTGGGWVVSVGIIINHENASRRVDKDCGKIAEIPMLLVQEPNKTLNFSGFWGEKSQLRRFQDGSVVDAVVWGANCNSKLSSTINRGDAIITEIIKNCIGLHVPARAVGDIYVVSNQLERVLPGFIGGESCAWAGESVTSMTKSAIESLDKLRGILTSQLKGLPLFVEGLSASSPYLRYTSMFPPIPQIIACDDAQKKAYLKEFAGHNISLQTSVLLLIATIESSASWPVSDFAAFENMKRVYLMKMSDLLKAQFQIESKIVEGALDVLYQGQIFRVQLLCKDAQGRSILLPGDVDIGSTKHVNGVLMNIKRTLEVEPLHHQMIHNYHAKHSDGAFATTVRLMMFWISSQLFTCYFSQECIELLVASVFATCDQSMFRSPGSGLSGFIRCLARLCEYLWESKPLVVPWDNKFEGNENLVDVSDMKKGSVRPTLQRVKLSATESFCKLWNCRPAIFICGAYGDDDFDCHFTRTYAHGGGSAAPESMVLNMVRIQAKKTLLTLRQWMSGGCCWMNEEDVINFIMAHNDDITSRAKIVVKFRKSLCLEVESALRGNDLLQSAVKGAEFATLQLFANLHWKQLSVGELLSKSAIGPNAVLEGQLFKLFSQFHNYALFFWDRLVPRVLYIVLRPKEDKNFSILKSRYCDGCVEENRLVLDIKHVIENCLDSIVLK